MEKEGNVEGREGKVTVVYIYINTYMIYYTLGGGFPLMWGSVNGINLFWGATGGTPLRD